MPNAWHRFVKTKGLMGKGLLPKRGTPEHAKLREEYAVFRDKEENGKYYYLISSAEDEPEH